MSMEPPSPPRPASTYIRLIRYTRPYLRRLIVGTVFGILFAGSTTALLPALKQTIGHIFTPEDIQLATVLTVALMLPVFGLVRGLGYYLSVYFIEWVGNRVVMDLRMETFERLQQLSIGYFTRSKAGELISRTANDTMLVERAVSTVLGDLVRQPFLLLGLLGVLFWLDPILAAISLVLFPVCILPVALFGRRVRRYARQGQQKLADIVSILQESIAGVRVVRAFGMEQYERDRFNKQCRAVFGRIMRVTKAKAAIDPIIVEISIIGFSMLLLYSYWVDMPVETFFTFGAALIALYEPVKRLSRIHLTIQQSSAAADRIFEILDADVTVKERPGAVSFDEPVRSVTYEDVGFAYETEPVLSDINLTVSAGQCIALVGSSGSGKTTLVSLLLRFYDVTSGRILINDRDIRDISLSSLRGLMGLVSQDTFLFNDTVAANIAYGRQDAPQEALEDAARRAHAHEFITELPDGYDTIVGDRGVRLSGGQCQRLSIARAILRNPPILVLDEATSALDTESERQVQAALDELMSNRTVFAIAHRLSTIAHANRILVLDKGRVVEEGTHDELLAKSGLYRYLYDLQFQV